MKRLRGNWIDYHLYWVRHDQSTKTDWRSDFDVDRLEFLRQKQQPGTDWSIDWYQTLDWDNDQLGCPISKEDAYEANKISADHGWVIENSEARDARQTLAYFWTPVRVKACLRAQGMLPWKILKDVKPQTQWRSLQAKIAELGDYPPLSEVFISAIEQVYTEGYSTALREIFSGDVADRTQTAKRFRQQRACDLICDILRAWEAKESALKAGRSNMEHDMLVDPLEGI